MSTVAPSKSLSKSDSDPISRQQQVENDYRPPQIHVGMWLYWYHGANAAQQPFAALVVSVADKSVDLQVWDHRGRTFHKPAVRHVNDPHLRVRLSVAEEFGGWTHSPESRLLADLLPDTSQPTDDQKIALKLVAEGLDASAVAAEMGGDWTHQKVSSMKRKFPDYEA